MPAKITAAKLARDLLPIIRLEDFRARFRLLDSRDCVGCAHWENDGSKLTVTIDPSQDGWVPVAIHEAIHYYYRDWLKQFDRKLEEEIVAALDHQVLSYVRERPPMMMRWRRAVAAKLAVEQQKGETNAARAGRA